MMKELKMRLRLYCFTWGMWCQIGHPQRKNLVNSFKIIKKKYCQKLFKIGSSYQMRCRTVFLRCTTSTVLCMFLYILPRVIMLLFNIAEQAHFHDKVPIYDSTFQEKGENRVVRLIRTACKAFAFGGDERTGCHSRFVTWIKPWLEENKHHSWPLTRFSHNR